MTVTLDKFSLLLAELVRRRIEVRADGDKLLYRPRRAMTPDLAERIRANKAELLALIRAPAAGPGLSARARAARMIRDARRAGSRQRAIDLRDVWRERIAICTIDGGLSADEAESMAEKQLRNMLPLQ